MIKHSLAILVIIAVASSAAEAGLIARIGDLDGFGYGAAPGFIAANGRPANTNGDGVLGAGEFLPDINRNGNVRTGGGDDFDFRNTSEINNTGNSFSPGVTNTSGMRGSNFTDIALAQSYDSSSNSRNVLIGGNPNTGLVFGTGGAFPSPPSSTLPNQPGFVFSFDIDKVNLTSQPSIFFNLVFGDYDISPAQILITRADGSTRNISISTQPNGEDGLIQAATATLPFGDVFTDGGTFWHASLRVDFVAPNEPYTSFDFVELNTIALVTTVPEPSSIAMVGLGMASLAVLARRRRRA